jgi:hypothetical protein
VPPAQPAHKGLLGLLARLGHRDCRVQLARQELPVRLVLRVRPVHKVRLVPRELPVLPDQSALKVQLALEVIKDHPEFKASREFQAHKAQWVLRDPQVQREPKVRPDLPFRHKVIGLRPESTPKATWSPGIISFISDFERARTLNPTRIRKIGLSTVQSGYKALRDLPAPQVHKEFPECQALLVHKDQLELTVQRALPAQLVLRVQRVRLARKDQPGLLERPAPWVRKVLKDFLERELTGAAIGVPRPLTIPTTRSLTTALVGLP